MYHQAKPVRRRRRLRWGFRLAGIWAAALCLLLALTARAKQREGAEGIRVLYCGQSIRAEAAGCTGRALLEALGLPLTAADQVSPHPDTLLQPGDTLTVVRRQYTRETFTLALPADTEYRPDDTLPWGREVELAPGTPGELRCVAKVTYVNGLPVSREIVDRQLLCPAVPRLVAVGTREDCGVTLGPGCLWLPEGEMLPYSGMCTLEATAFSPEDPGCIPQARKGTALVPSATIAPGTRLFILAADGSWLYGMAQAVASDCLAENRIDLYLPPEEAAEFGRRQCNVYFLG